MDISQIAPTYVVVDTNDGMTFHRSADGKLFSRPAAFVFADQRNESQKNPSHLVFKVTQDMDYIIGDDLFPNS